MGLFAPTNHQLFNKKATWDWEEEYSILLGYKKKNEQATVAIGDRSEAPSNIQILQSAEWSNLLNEVRTYFETENSETIYPDTNEC